MTPEEQAFEDELRIFRENVDDCITFLYAFESIYAIAGQYRMVHRSLNRDALFWNSILRGLQTALIVSLHRVFGNDSPHGVGQLMRIARVDRAIFSRRVLRTRVQSRINDPDVVDAYVQNAVVPHVGDFRRVARMIGAHRRIYMRVYERLRHEVFAHTVLTDRDEVTRLFSQTRFRELERMTTFLRALHDGFVQTFYNGKRLSIRPTRHAIGRILARLNGQTQQRRYLSVQESMVKHARHALLSLGAAPETIPRRRK